MEAMLENYNGADYEYSAPVCLQLCQQAFFVNSNENSFKMYVFLIEIIL